MRPPFDQNGPIPLSRRPQGNSGGRAIMASQNSMRGPNAAHTGTSFL